MQLPLELRFHNLDHSPAVEAAVRKAAAKLERFAGDIVSCRVTIEGGPQKHHQQGNLFAVRIDVRYAGGEVVASREPTAHQAHEDVYVAVRDAFKAARRQLQDRMRIRRGDVKPHDVEPHGKVLSIDSDRDCGVIATSDGREVYFHRNSVLDGGFAHLKAGTEVRLVVEQGDKGPQASTVRAIGKHHLVD
jgi:cold shock CspA family protein/ribosome-associated translation inhibitor RaiA